MEVSEALSSTADGRREVEVDCAISTPDLGWQPVVKVTSRRAGIACVLAPLVSIVPAL
jgi:hypothetical protein